MICKGIFICCIIKNIHNKRASLFTGHWWELKASLTQFYKTTPFICLFNFYWSTVNLQCRIGFKCRAKWIKYTRRMCAQSSPTLCNSMDCSPPGLSVHGIFQMKNTGVGCQYSSPGESSQPRDQTHISCIGFPLPLSRQGSPSSMVVCDNRYAAKMYM